MADRKIELSNTLALFNLIRILEDWLIQRFFFFSLLLLPVDLTVLSAVLLSRFERFVSYSIVGGFLRYLNHDLRILKELGLMVLQKEYVSEELTRDPAEGEKELGGKAFKRTQLVLRFLWSLLIFLLFFPLFPILWLWNHFIRLVLIGWLYYLILFGISGVLFHPLLQVYLFSIATFWVAITTVPFIFSLFVYFKSLFELESRSFKEIKLEADTLFVRLYRYSFDEESSPEEGDELPKGGLYYLFLKALHATKDQTFGLVRWVIRRKSANALLERLKLERVKDEIFRQLEERRPIRTSELLVPLFAFIFTFFVAFVLVFAGTHGEGVLGKLLLSVLSDSDAELIWFGGALRQGYVQVLLAHIPFLQGLFSGIGFFTDQLFGYLFLAWHSSAPYYLDFIGFYYRFLGGWFSVLLS